MMIVFVRAGNRPSACVCKICAIKGARWLILLSHSSATFPTGNLTSEGLFGALKKTLTYFVCMATHTQYGKQLCNVKDVYPDKKNWKVLVQVLQKKKGGISMSGGSPSQYRGYLFVDMAGTFVSAVCHGTDVAYFESSLIPYKRYYISNATVRPIRTGYEVSDYKFSWTLNTTAVVQPYEETLPPQIPYDFQFKKFSDMFKYADSEVPFNIKDLVLKAFPEKKVGLDKNGKDLIVKDFVVTDDEYIPMIMRLWKEKLHDYADLLSDGLPEPIFFLGMHMKVTTFNGLSLSSRLQSIFLKDPLVHGATALKEWYALNKETVDGLVHSEAYKDTNKLLQKPTAKDIITVQHAMENLEELKTAWIVGRLQLIQGQDRYWYMACKNCHKSLRNAYQNENPCPKCGVTEPISFRCHISVMIIDDTETAYAELYSPDAELLIPFTAAALKEAEEENRSVTAQLESALNNKHVVCYIKYFDKVVRGAVTRKYPLSKIYRYEDVFGAVESSSKQALTDFVASTSWENKDAVDLTKDDEDNVQFFTPSTKAVLQQISEDSQAHTADTNITTSCKRVLSFGDISKAAVTVKIEPPDDDFIVQEHAHVSGTDESPVKKPKPKLKQN